MAVNKAQTVSQLLQDNWSLTSPLAVANIAWPTTLLDAIGITQGGTIQVAVYNSSGAKQVDPLSRECYLVTEEFTVDVIVRNAGQDHNSLAAAEATLTEIIQEVYRIIHLQDPNYEVAGEPIHANAPEVTRCMINVDAVYFHISA
jgi:hypothetical protein